MFLRHIIARLIALSLVLTLIMLALAAPLLAGDGQVVVPWGDWISSLLTIINGLPIGALVAGWLVALLAAAGLPSQLSTVIKTMLTDQFLNKAVTYGINAVQGAVHGKTLSVPVANQVIEEAADYVVQHGPDWLIQWLGGVEGIKARIIARIQLPGDAQVQAGSVVSGPPGA